MRGGREVDGSSHQPRSGRLGWTGVSEILAEAGMASLAPEVHARLFRHSQVTVFAYVGDELAGFGRALFGGVKDAGIFDVAVAAAHPGKGRRRRHPVRAAERAGGPQPHPLRQPGQRGFLCRIRLQADEDGDGALRRRGLFPAQGHHRLIRAGKAFNPASVMRPCSIIRRALRIFDSDQWLRGRRGVKRWAQLRPSSALFSPSIHPKQMASSWAESHGRLAAPLLVHYEPGLGLGRAVRLQPGAPFLPGFGVDGQSDVQGCPLLLHRSVEVVFRGAVAGSRPEPVARVEVERQAVGPVQRDRLPHSDVHGFLVAETGCLQCGIGR